MTFLTIFFFAFSLAALVKGNMFKKLRIDVGEYEIKKAIDSTAKVEESLLIRMLSLIFFMSAIMVLEIIYLLKALHIDPYIYPTIIMILLILTGYIFTKSSKKDLATESGIAEYRKKLHDNKRKVSGILRSVLKVIYFAYMFYILVF